MWKIPAVARHLPALCLGLSLVLTLLAAATGNAWLTFAVVAASILLEAWVGTRSGNGGLVLEQAGLGVIARFLLRVVAVTLMVTWTPSLAVAFLAAVSLLTAGWCLAYFCRGQLAKAYASPILVRNLDIPTAGSSRPRPIGLVVAGAVGEAGVLLPTLLGAPTWLVVLLGLLAAASLFALTVPLAREVLRNRHERVPVGELPPKLRPLQDFIHHHRPEVLVHLSGGLADTYQINVWLETLEQLDQRVLLLLRNPDMFEAMAPTTLPAACVRSGTDLMSLDLSAATVVLFPANVGSNLHVLRLPSLMSAFIGHGDSDKSASVNPYGKVYDELWVAGEAGASRWRRAGVGIHEDQLVKVGRPQIAAVEVRAPREPGARPTLLYAPTWEGWNAAQNYCSVSVIGTQLIEAALAHPAGIRVIYKPHPMLGRRDPKVLAAHSRLVRLLTAAGGGHEVVTAGGRALFDCFNASDALATDISSVVSDYLASEKPYAVFNFSGADATAFTADFPTASAGTLLGRDGDGIAGFLDLVGGGPDPQQPGRSALATFLLGPPEMRTREPFQQAVTALSARTRRERAVYRSDAAGLDAAAQVGPRT
jgi:CDP-glycerol:poly(glycerophosphate) glycerophosphotransferase